MEYEKESHRHIKLFDHIAKTFESVWVPHLKKMLEIYWIMNDSTTFVNVYYISCICSTFDKQSKVSGMGVLKHMEKIYSLAVQSNNP